jgi:hypothetical protein
MAMATIIHIMFGEGGVVRDLVVVRGWVKLRSGEEGK